MASTVTAGTLTVTIQESITLNNRDRGGSTTLSVSSIGEIANRIVSVASGSEVELIKFGAAGRGEFVAANLKYLRLTNLDDTNFVRLRFSRTSGHTADFKLPAGKSFILTEEDISVHATAGAFSSFSAMTNINARADTAAVDVEYYVATT